MSGIKTRYAYPDEYMKAPMQVEAILDGIRAVYQRSGVSCPGFADRAAYHKDGQYYIYENGELIDYQEWHEQQKERG